MGAVEVIQNKKKEKTKREIKTVERVFLSSVRSGDDPAKFAYRANTFVKESSFFRCKQSFGFSEIRDRIISKAVTEPQSYEGIETFIGLVDRGLAGDILMNNVSNIPIAFSRIATYMRDIVAGRWSYNGQTMILDNKGRLVNGQKRLIALYLLEDTYKIEPMPFNFVIGINNPNALLTVDYSQSRNFAHYIRNFCDTRHKYERNIPTITRFLLEWQDFKPAILAKSLTHLQQMDFFQENKEFIINCSETSYRYWPLTPRISSYLRFISRHNLNAAKVIELFLKSIAKPNFNDHKNGVDHVCVQLYKKFAIGNKIELMSFKKNGKKCLYYVMTGLKYYLEGEPYKKIKTAGYSYKREIPELNLDNYI